MDRPENEFYRWWIVDASTGERSLTPYKLSRANAAKAFPGAEPDLETCELHDVFTTGPALNSRPGGDWC